MSPAYALEIYSIAILVATCKFLEIPSPFFYKMGSKQKMDVVAVISMKMCIALACNVPWALQASFGISFISNSNVDGVPITPSSSF